MKRKELNSNSREESQAENTKVVITGRQLFVKLMTKHRTLLEQVQLALKEFEPPPI